MTLEDNLKSFTINEIKDIIRKHNQFNAIQGWSKYTKKADLIKYLVDNHTQQLKTVKHKDTYRTYWRELIAGGNPKKALEQFRKLPEFAKYILGEIVGKKEGVKSSRAFILNTYIKPNVPLPETASEDTKKIYKEELKKWKKASDKMFAKASKKKESGEAAAAAEPEPRRRQSPAKEKIEKEIKDLIKTLSREEKLLMFQVDDAIERGSKSLSSMIDSEKLHKLFKLKLKLKK